MMGFFLSTTTYQEFFLPFPSTHAVYFLFYLLHLSEIYSTILIKFPKGWLDVPQVRTPSWKNMNCNLREPGRSLAKIRRENIICHYYYDCKTTIGFAFPLLIIIYNLLIESVVIIGKSQTEAWDFPVITKRTRLVSYLLYDIFSASVIIFSKGIQ